MSTQTLQFPQRIPQLDRGMSIQELALMREGILSVLDDGDPKCDCERKQWHFFLANEAESDAARLDFCEAVSAYVFKRIKALTAEATGDLRRPLR